MNKKGENSIGQVGMFIGIFTLVIVGIALFQASAQQVGLSSDLSAIENQSLTAAAVNDTAQFFTNFKSISGVLVFNATGDIEVDSGNFTITNNVINPTTGALSVRIVPGVSTAPDLGYRVGVWTIDGTAQSLGYIPESGARSIASIIVIFFALAIAVVTLIPTLRSEILSRMGR